MRRSFSGTPASASLSARATRLNPASEGRMAGGATGAGAGCAGIMEADIFGPISRLEAGRTPRPGNSTYEHSFWARSSAWPKPVRG